MGKMGEKGESKKKDKKTRVMARVFSEIVN